MMMMSQNGLCDKQSKPKNIKFNITWAENSHAWENETIGIFAWKLYIRFNSVLCVF